MLSKRNHIKKNILLQNSTKPFRDIIVKYQKNEKNKIMNNKQLLLKKIEAKIEKEKSKEKENEFIVNEVQKDIKLKDKLISTFGMKALNHYSETKNMKIKIKLEKSKLFNPLFECDSSKFNIFKKGYTPQKFNSHKIIKFPKIINNNLKFYDEFVEKNKKNIQKINKNILDTSVSMIKINEYSFDNKNDVSDMEQNKNNDNISIKKYIFSNKKNNTQDNKEKNLNQFDASNNISEKSKINSTTNIFPHLLKTPLMTERNNSNLFKNLNTNIKKKYNIFNLDYLNDIQTIRDKLLLEERKNLRFFESHQYGCDKYKIKYNYIKEKYFD